MANAFIIVMLFLSVCFALDAIGKLGIAWQAIWKGKQQ